MEHRLRQQMWPTEQSCATELRYSYVANPGYEISMGEMMELGLLF